MAAVRSGSQRRPQAGSGVIRSRPCGGCEHSEHSPFGAASTAAPFRMGGAGHGATATGELSRSEVEAGWVLGEAFGPSVVVSRWNLSAK